MQIDQNLIFATKTFQYLNFTEYKTKYFRGKSHSNTSILPNTKSNRLTYHVSYQGTSSNFPFIIVEGKQIKISFSRQSHSNSSIYQTCRRIQTKISFSRQESIQYFHFTKYKTKQVHIACLQQGTTREKFKLPIYQSCRQIDQNLIFATKSFQFFHLSNLQAHIYQNLIFATRVNPILSIYQIQNLIGSNSMFATRDDKGEVQTSHLSNFATSVILILSFYRI